jgi:hypothetical protein
VKLENAPYVEDTAYATTLKLAMLDEVTVAEPQVFTAATIAKLKLLGNVALLNES